MYEPVKESGHRSLLETLPPAVKPNPIALLIDDDKANRRLLRTLLESQHYRLFETQNGQSGLSEVVTCQPDVIILDWALPDMGGLKVLEQLRQSAQTPVLVLSVSHREEDAVAALNGGANDYMTKPFGGSELLARLRVLRRCISSESNEPVLMEEGLTVNMVDHEVVLSGRKIDLTPTEEALLHTLVTYVGRVVTCRHLLRSVWGVGGENQGPSLRVFISTLRKKLEDARGTVAIETTGSLGYRLALQNRSQYYGQPVEHHEGSVLS